MKIVRALLAATALLLAIPSTHAHAACPSWSTMSGYSLQNAKNSFAPALVCTLAQLQPPYDACVHPGAVTTVYNCTQAGVTGIWELTINASCSTNPNRTNAVVKYLPNPTWYTFHQECHCSESTTTCSWY